MSLSLATSMVKVWVEFEEFSRDNTNHSSLIHQTYMKVLLVISYVLRCLVLLYILVRLLLSIVFFLRMKKRALNDQGLSLTFLNWLIITALVIIILSRLAQYLVINIISISAVVSDDNIERSNALKIYWLVFRGYIAPTRDLCELLLIVYFLYFQDKKNTESQRTISIGRGRTVDERKRQEKDNFFK